MLSLLLLATSLVASAQNVDYCSMCSDHTMCLYPNDGPGDTCTTVLERNVNGQEQTEILAAHNAIRRRVKNGDFANNNLPAAEVMPDLSWNDQLAVVAQRWADQCNFNHDACRKIEVEGKTEGETAGQNLAAAWRSPGSSKNWTEDAINPWFYDELDAFTQNDLTFRKASSYPAGHLTQVIWADSTEVGCGFIAFEDTQNIPDYGPYTFTRRHYVCNYFPAGNIINQQIYQPA
ncbi:venom allergen 3-like [Amphibalanus amphitrite]|nr:venom allergen 3-like [Amphibalanus amphitrite]XP_043232237.1 venom allergen 3-like [Amphibalanus amphitrite]